MPSLLRIVLLCKGKGGDPASFKPDRDESQWWNRRDALVRCVAASLFSGSSSDTELILIFDEDFTRFHMEKKQMGENTSSGCFPKEQTIVSIWKEASKNPNELIERHGLSCRLVENERGNRNQGDSFSMESKRKVLQFLQKQCSMDFLRRNGLNADANVVLRKTNKKALMAVWHKWQQAKMHQGKTSEESHLADMFAEILQPVNETIDQVVCGILHESCDAELPCFGFDDDQQEPEGSLQMCLFLGAVRDMVPSENRILQKCCDESKIPLLRVRIGPTAEFTSKILSVVAFHHEKQQLGPAILRLMHLKAKTDASKCLAVEQQPSQLLHVVCVVPIPSKAVSSRLEDRCRILWCLVRIAVCTLWRSKLAGSNNSCVPLTNKLSLIFQDSRYVTLVQDELVSSLAEQHQAAPCEHQILKAIADKVGGAGSNTNLARVVSEWTQEAPTVVRLNGSASMDLVDSMYHTSLGHNVQAGQEKNVLLLMEVGADTKTNSSVRILKNACKQQRICVRKVNLVPSTTVEWEAVSISVVQHLVYQGILFSALNRASKKHNDERPRKKSKRG